jgi:succinate dehydrogenase / fumarate reductase membrane anchor subunit
MRLSGLALLGLALFHLIYLHFIIPGGVTAIDYLSIASRWTNPVSGFFWRFFDLLLLALALSHGAAGVHGAIKRSFTSRNVRMITNGGLVLAYLLLLTSSSWLIFTFQQ